MAKKIVIKGTIVLLFFITLSLICSVNKIINIRYYFFEILNVSTSLKYFLLNMMIKYNSKLLVFLFVMILLCSSCAPEWYGATERKSLCKIATKVNLKEVKASGNQNLSRGETKAPTVKTLRMEGVAGDMFVRFTSAAGIAEKKDKQSVESRGRLVTEDDFYDDYGLFVYEYPAWNTWTVHSSTTAATPVMANERVMKSMDWTTNEFWPGSGVRLAFYGYAPHNADGISNLPTLTTSGKPSFHYVTPTNAMNQTDLLVSEDDSYIFGTNEDGGVDVPGDYNVVKYLKFKHACTAVRIAVGDKMAPCTITKIAIKGVYGEADYNFGAGTTLNMGAWEIDSTSISDYELNADLVVDATDQNKVINSGKYAFMLLPQTVPDDATLEITINDGNTHVLKANIGGNQWDAGYSVTYFLSTASVDDKYVLTVSSPNTQIAGSGGNSSYAVQSYKQTFYGSQVAVPWEATYSVGSDPTEYDSPGSVVTDFTRVGSGGTTAKAYGISFEAAVPTSDPTTNTHTANLRSRAVLNNVNLAAGGETANCYVVTQPGTYKFPLVWGNAIKNNVANSSAYNSNTFVDYMGNSILDYSGPYIYTKYEPRDAVIVWQDSPNLVTPSSVKLDANKHYIEFEVNKDNICQGNCVIAVRDKDLNTMWSWHIWVTDYDWNATVEMKADDKIFNFMSAPAIGFCDAETRTSKPSAIRLYARQPESGKTSTLTYDIGINTADYGNNITSFQWGRKDPLIPSTGKGKGFKYTVSYNYVLTETINTANIAETIRNPHAFNISNGNTSYELWNVGNATTSVNMNPVVKSVYDPSPVGFHMPPSGVFQGWDARGRHSWQGTSGWAGRYFYQYGPGVGEMIFFQVYGYRDDSGGYDESLIRGGYWTSGPGSRDQGRLLEITSSVCDTDRLFRRLNGLPVRPVSD